MSSFNDSYEGAPISATNENARNRAIRRGKPIAGPGIISRVTPGGTVLTASTQPARRATRTLHPFLVTVYQDDAEAWQAKVRPGTINGLTPVVGSIVGTGGDPLTDDPPPPVELSAGLNLVVLAIKVDLETHDILRSTIEVREDSDVDDVLDTGARTLIRCIIIAELTETVSGGSTTWSKLSQTINTNLSYAYGTVWPNSL